MENLKDHDPNPGYTRIPEDFMKDVKLIPNNFDMPEKPLHGEIVHSQLREDLFDTAYQKVCDIEETYLKNDDDYFKLSKIEKEDCTNSTFI